MSDSRMPPVNLSRKTNEKDGSCNTSSIASTTNSLLSLSAGHNQLIFHKLTNIYIGAAMFSATRMEVLIAVECVHFLIPGRSLNNLPVWATHLIYRHTTQNNRSLSIELTSIMTSGLTMSMCIRNHPDATHVIRQYSPEIIEPPVA